MLCASSRLTKLLKMVWKARTLPCSAVSSGDVGTVDGSLAPLDARISVVEISTSFSRACRVSYEPS
jgi:hypothetical protein